MVPWQVACGRLPPIFEIQLVWPAVALAVKCLVHEAALAWVIERVWIIVNPSSIVQITSFMLPIYKLQQWQNEERKSNCNLSHCTPDVCLLVWEIRRRWEIMRFGSRFYNKKWYEKEDEVLFPVRTLSSFNYGWQESWAWNYRWAGKTTHGQTEIKRKAREKVGRKWIETDRHEREHSRLLRERQILV